MQQFVLRLVENVIVPTILTAEVAVAVNVRLIRAPVVEVPFAM